MRVYLVRYPVEYCWEYFAYMERRKWVEPSFEEALAYLYKYRMLEDFFSSKMVHTMDSGREVCGSCRFMEEHVALAAVSLLQAILHCCIIFMIY